MKALLTKDFWVGIITAYSILALLFFIVVGWIAWKVNNEPDHHDEDND